MLPGVGRDPPPGRGPPAPGPGRGPPCGLMGRGAGRSTGTCEENGLLPTRGGRGAAGLGPGRGPAGAAGAAPDAAGAVTTGAGGTAAGAGSGAGAAGLGAPGFGPVAAGADATSAAAAAALAGAFSGAGLDPPNASRRRRATGASTVEDADFTNSPCSLSRARTSLLVTPSSLANSCTRALPAATTSPSRRGDSGGPRLGFSYDAWSSGLHGVLMFFATCFSCSVVRRTPTWSTTAEGSGEPVTRSARANARRRTASVRHC